MTKPDDERKDDLAATSESLQQDAEHLVEIEEEKQDLDIADPKLDALSVEAERIAGDVQRKSRIQREISHSVSDGSGESGGRSN